jgi:hypothetical protein
MLRIGKNPTNDLVIKDRAAEDFHCILYISNGELIVEDLKSHYGTLVNGSKVSHALLYPGDELQIGFTRIEWQKLMPALQAIGDTNDADSFLQAQDLNLDVREDSAAQELNETLLPSDYTIDSTAELIELAMISSNIMELDFPVSVKEPNEELKGKEADSDKQENALKPSTSFEVLEGLSNPSEVAMKVKDQTNPVSNIQSRKRVQSDPFKQYYFLLAILLSAMVIAGIAIAIITG